VSLGWPRYGARRVWASPWRRCSCTARTAAATATSPRSTGAPTRSGLRLRPRTSPHGEAPVSPWGLLCPCCHRRSSVPSLILMGLKALGSQQTRRSVQSPIRPAQYNASSPGSLGGPRLWRAAACLLGRLQHKPAWLLSWAGGWPAPPWPVSPSRGACAHARRAPRRRVFSLDPVEGYRPPTLAGHRDALVGVFFAHAAAAAAAATTGATPPALLTVSRDGALFCWAYTRQPRGVASEPDGGAPGAHAEFDEAAGAAAAAADGAERDAAGARPAKRRRVDGAAAAPPAFAGGPGPCMRMMRPCGRPPCTAPLHARAGCATDAAELSSRPRPPRTQAGPVWTRTLPPAEAPLTAGGPTMRAPWVKPL